MSKSPIGNAAPRRRRGRLLVASLAGLMLLLGFATIVTPTPLARFLLAQQAEAIGVEVDGLDTLSTNIFSSTIEAGPVQITAPGAPPGELGRLSLQYDLKGLFQGRILIESLVLDGIDLKIQRKPDGALRINGVELETLLASATGDRAAREGSAGGAWQVGIDRLEVRASQAVLEDVNGGLLELDLRRLSLADFRSWEPELPGQFEFDVSINGIDVKWSGGSASMSSSIHHRPACVVTNWARQSAKRWTLSTKTSKLRSLVRAACRINCRASVPA